MARVLVVEDSPTQAQQLGVVLEEAGFEVELTANGLEALEAVRRQMPDLVITDLEMPRMNGLELVENIRSTYPALPVVLMTAYGSEDIAALALQKGAASYVPKRYLAEDIIPTVENILAVVRAEGDGHRILECLTELESRFVLGNDVSLVPVLIGYVEEQLTQMGLCDQAALIQVCVALREALMNAIEHGNLELSSELSERGDDSFEALGNQRRGEDPYRSRRVYFRANVSRQRAEFAVRDEGPGFDPSILADPTDPANLEKLRGRGLLLIRTFMDPVYHNESGNEITMVKRRE